MRLVWHKVRRITVTKCQKKHPCVDQWKKSTLPMCMHPTKNLFQKLGGVGGGGGLDRKTEGEVGLEVLTSKTISK